MSHAVSFVDCYSLANADLNVGCTVLSIPSRLRGMMEEVNKNAGPLVRVN